MTLDSNTSFTCSADSGVDTANEKVNKKNLNKIKKCLDNCLWQEKVKIFFFTIFNVSDLLFATNC